MTNDTAISTSDKRKLFHTLFFPSLFVFILWFIKCIEALFDINDLYLYGVYPQNLQGLKGILFAPLLHGDWEHLLSNTPAIFILTTGLFYFYRPIHYRVFFIMYFVSGIWLWAFGRSSYHIGASGLIYGLAFFLFFSGIIKKDYRLMGVSAVVLFLYGSIFMSMFPWVKDNISWEAHLMGAISGLFLAIYYRKEGPQKKEYIWNDDDENEENDSTTEEIKNEQKNLPIEIIYHYKKEENDDKT